MANISKDSFNVLYFGDKLSLRMVAEKLNTNHSRLRDWMKKNHIQSRSRSEAVKNAHSKKRYKYDRENNPNWKGGIGDPFLKYGIEKSDYLDMLNEQDGKCAICERKFEGRPNIDHCHITNLVRGLLCRSCNTGIGFLKDDIKTLYSAIRYLNEARWNG